MRSTISYVVAFALALLFLWQPFSAQGRAAPRWIRIALWLSGSLGVAWALLGIAGSFTEDPLSGFPLSERIRLGVGGAVCGIVLLLFLSGEFFTPSSRPRQKRDDVLQ